jgi:hypothetical protein
MICVCQMIMLEEGECEMISGRAYIEKIGGLDPRHGRLDGCDRNPIQGYGRYRNYQAIMAEIDRAVSQHGTNTFIQPNITQTPTVRHT